MADPPRRIQRKRTKGWRLPPNTVCVTRPGRWGNPYLPCGKSLDDRARALACFRVGLLSGRLGFCVDDVRRELRGKNLACWCPLESPCHADVLLEIANA